jgi:drug/metabolite transporter (DMT)-like permease
MKQLVTNRHSHYLTCLLLIFPPLFWAGNSVLARGVIELIPPVSLAFWRWTLALLILLPFTLRHLRRDRAQIQASWKIILLISLLGIAAFNTILYTAAHTTTAINIALTQSVMPAVIVLISFVLYGERINRYQVSAVILCIAGAAYILMQGDWQRLMKLEFVPGDLLMLIAICCYALYSVLLKKRPAIHPLSFLTASFAVGVVLLFPLYVWEFARTAPLDITAKVVASLLYVAIFPSILAYLCWNRGVQEIGANRTGLFINLIPLFTSLLAILILKERFKSVHLMGILLIAGGLLLFNFSSHWRSRGKTT